MENQTHVKAPASTEPIGTWINGVIMTVMNIGVEVGKSMLRQSLETEKIVKERDKINRSYEALIDDSKRYYDKLRLEISTLADENKVLRTMNTDNTDGMVKVTDKGTVQLESSLGE